MRQEVLPDADGLSRNDPIIIAFVGPAGVFAALKNTLSNFNGGVLDFYPPAL